MTEFEALFGIRKNSIKKVCILLPFLGKGVLKKFNIDELKRGKLFACQNSRHFTLIHTGIGPCFSGDAVLHLKETQCRDIIFLGSCGLTNTSSGLGVGSLVAPGRCYAFESFSQILLNNTKSPTIGYANKELLDCFLNHPCASGFQKTVGATFGSLKLEPTNKDLFIKNKVDVVDMECSALFTAAKYAEKRAIALLYATDIIDQKPYYSEISDEDKAAIDQTINQATQSILQFSKFLFSI